MPSHFLHLMWQENFENPIAYTHKKEQVQLLIPVGINDQHKKKKKKKGRVYTAEQCQYMPFN